MRRGGLWALCALLAAEIALAGCGRMKRAVNDWIMAGLPAIPGYETIYFARDEIGRDRTTVRSWFRLRPQEGYASVDLVLQDLGANGFVYERAKPMDAIIYDAGASRPLTDLLRGAEIEIKGKNTDLKISSSEMKQMVNERGLFGLYKPYLRIPLASLPRVDRRYEVRISAPNVGLRTWRARFVVGAGMTGSL